MKVMIDIPKEFEEDLKDNFQEFFNRMIADITYSLNDEEPMCCGNYERETAEMFLSAFEKATVIHDNATKGDMIKAMFHNCECSVHEYMGIKCGIDVKIYFYEDQYFTVWFPTNWWNAPYKKGTED